MKKLLFISLSVCLSLFCYSQTDEQKQQLELFKNMYKVEGADVVFSKILDSISGTKEEIYTKVLNYFAVAYKSANDVIQQKDKEAGVVIGKGIFNIEKTNLMGNTVEWSVNHIIRIDCKDNRIRIIVSVNEYNRVAKTTQGIQRLDFNLLETYPFSEKGKVTKKQSAELLIKMCVIINCTFADIEKSLKNETQISADDNW